MSRDSKTDDWLKEIDIARGVENTLVGAVLFVGRYCKTFFYLMFRPGPLEADLIFNESYKTVTHVNFTRPLSFLVVSGFLYLAFTMSTAGILMPIHALINQTRWLIDRFPKNFEEMSLTTMSAFMVPFILFVALYALTSFFVFASFGRRVPFKIYLNISAYLAGCYAVLTSIWAVTEGPVYALTMGANYSIARAVPLLAAATGYLLLLIWCTYRYLDLLHRATKLSWPRTIISAVSSFVLFWLLTVGTLNVLRPFFSKPKLTIHLPRHVFVSHPAIEEASRPS
jgi:hypothetical protein